MQLIFASWLLLLVASSTGTAFISPGPSVSYEDLSISTTVHPVGSKFHIAWNNTILDRKMSVVLWQYNATSKDVVYPFEDVTRKSPCNKYNLGRDLELVCFLVLRRS